MAKPTSPYQPIDCNFYDILLERATLRHPARIRYLAGGGPDEVVALIEDVYTQNKEEFMRLHTGQLIRLDQLIAVDGVPLPEGGSCSF
jgi:Rho-binding antiterminator